MNKKVFALILLVVLSAVALASNEISAAQEQNQVGISKIDDNTEEKSATGSPWKLTPTVIIAVAAVIGVGLSTRFSLHATTIVRKTARGELIMKIKKAEGSAGMLDAMMYLVGWVEERDKDGIDWLKEFRDLRRDSSRYCQIKKVDECRRMFSYYYTGMNILKKHGLLSENMVNDLLSTHQKDFYEQLVKPLTEQIEVRVTKEWPELTVDYPEGYKAMRKLWDIEQKKINAQKKK